MLSLWYKKRAVVYEKYLPSVQMWICISQDVLHTLGDRIHLRSSSPSDVDDVLHIRIFYSGLSSNFKSN